MCMQYIPPLISHESPLSMLTRSKEYNDYDYILVHLLEEHEEYLNYFINAKKEGRRSLMDTSIFELGKAFNIEKYAEWVEKLQPTEYILPDVLENCNETIENSSSFKTKYSSKLSGKTIGVIQGKNYEEVKACYKILDKMLNVDKIAISFDYAFYSSLCYHPNIWVQFMLGRMTLINRLLVEGVLNTNKPHHLLGCSNPMEFEFYKHHYYNFIESIDTSSPIVHGLKGVRYADKIGTWEKEKTKLADLITAKVDDKQLEDIMFNIAKFRQYVH